jgi:signal transduction histidine kinase
MIKGDIRSVGRVLRNLLDNAVRHATSRVSVEVRQIDRTAVLRIADDGPGIPVEDRNRIFDRFVRLDSDRSRQGGGAGLGLAIVAEIVAAHGATIRVDDPPTGGTVFTVTFAHI